MDISAGGAHQKVEIGQARAKWRETSVESVYPFAGLTPPTLIAEMPQTRPHQLISKNGFNKETRLCENVARNPKRISQLKAASKRQK